MLKNRGWRQVARLGVVLGAIGAVWLAGGAPLNPGW
jgi:hypothetical protein